MEETHETPREDNPFSGLDYNESIDSALATMHESQVQFSIMADAKANIMITVCSILLGIALAKIEQGELVLPLSLFAAGCVPALMFSILTVLPSASPTGRRVADVSQLPHFNPLFFIHFSLVPLKVFQRELARVVGSPRSLYEGLSRDLYYAGVVISTKKFRYLRWSYLSLLGGIAVGSVAFAFELIR